MAEQKGQIYTAIARKLGLDQLPEAQFEKAGTRRVRVEDRSRNQVALTCAWGYLGLLDLFNVGKDTVASLNGTFNRHIAYMSDVQAQAWITAAQGAVTGLYQQLIKPYEPTPILEDSDAKPLAPLFPLIAVSALGILQRVKEPGLAQNETRTRAYQVIVELKEQGDDRAYKVITHRPDKFRLPEAT